MLPAIVLFGLILVNFLPPISLPKKIPPTSVRIHIERINNINILSLLS